VTDCSAQAYTKYFDDDSVFVHTKYTFIAVLFVFSVLDKLE